jgi:hypothetical protein
MGASNRVCCVGTCTRIGSQYDIQGNVYCTFHFREMPDGESKDDFSAQSSGAITSSVRCDVCGCAEEGVVQHLRSGKRYCALHAWKSDRPDEMRGLTHPVDVIEWDETDIAFLKACGING